MLYRLEHCDAPRDDAERVGGGQADRGECTPRRMEIGRCGAWSAGREFFKKHGLVLEFMFARDNAETEQRVISGSADIGSAVDVMEVMRSYSFRRARPNY